MLALTPTTWFRAVGIAAPLALLATLAKRWWIVDGGLRMKSPWTVLGVGGWRWNRELFEDPDIDVGTAQFLACTVIESA